MKNFFFTILALFIGFNTVFAQSADPAITGANFVPNQINTGQTSVLTISFATGTHGSVFFHNKMLQFLMLPALHT
jgi:hypothetical protein